MKLTKTMARKINDEIELKSLNSKNDYDNKSFKDEKKEKCVNFASNIQISDDVTSQKPVKTVQFSKPQVSFEEPPHLGIEIKPNLIPNRKREEEQVMENLRRHVGDFQLDKNWKQKPSEMLDDKNNNDYDDHGTQPLLTKTKQQEPPQTTDKDFLVDCLCWHNEFRARHNVPALNLSKKLCVSAQEWANHLALRQEVFYCPPSIFNFGQNIFCCAETALMLSISGQEVATFWYSQMKRYDFSKPPSILHTNINSGHFSQTVWKNTKFMGVGKATAKSGKIYVVAFYYPPGNIAGEYHENVFPPLEILRPESANSNNLQPN